MPDLFSANPGGDPSHDRAFAALAPTSRAIGMRTEPMVNARNLHGFLEVSNHFKDWITDRIEQYGFLENQDFVSLAENSAKPQGGRPSKEYYLILDMAKELAMVERNQKGRQARRYFLECERRAKAMVPVVDFNDLRSLQAAFGKVLEKGIAAEERAEVAETKNVALTATMEVLEPKAAYADALAEQAKDWGIRHTCKGFASEAGMKITEVEKFVKTKYLYKRSTKSPLLPRAEYQLPHKNWFTVKDSLPDENGKVHEQTYFTAEGRQEVFAALMRWRKKNA